MLWVIGQLGILMVYNLCLLLLFGSYNEKLFVQEASRRYKYLTLFVLVGLKSVVNLYNEIYMNLLFALLSYLIISMIYYKGSTSKKIIFTCYYGIASFISEMSAYMLSTYVFVLSLFVGESLVYVSIQNAISLMILYAMTNLITKMNDMKHQFEANQNWYFLLFPMISIIILFYMMRSDFLMMYPMLFLLIMVGLVLLNVLLYKGFTDILDVKNLQIEHEKEKIQELHYALLEEKVENSNRFLHDIKKHVNLLSAYVHQQEYEKLEAYLKQLSTDIKIAESFAITGNPTMDLVLHANKDVIRNHSIELHYDVKLKEVDPMTIYDFNIVFANVLEYAIESCIRTQERFIKIKLDRKNELLVLKVINPCLEVNEGLKTCKEEKETHGYGIQNIKRIVEQYHGSAKFVFDEKQQIFETTVIVGDTEEEPKK